jgi:glucose dehydrogenase
MNLHIDLADSWNYILSGLDVVGLVALRAVGKKNAKGWLWAMFTQAVWMVYSVSTFQWGFLAVAAVKFGVYTWNWTSWIRSDKAENKPKTHQERALELVKEILPPGTSAIVQAQAANFLTRALTVTEAFPEKVGESP